MKDAYDKRKWSEQNLNSRVLTTIALCSATLTLITTAAPAAAAVTTNGNRSGISRVGDPTNTPKAAIDTNFSNGQPTDVAGATKFKVVGEPKVTTDANMSGEVASFDGSNGYLVPMEKENYKAMENGVAIETFFKYEGGIVGEHDIFSNQESGGLGLGIVDGKLNFFAHDGQGYKQPKAKVKLGKWVHAVGVIDVENKKTNLYVNGTLVDQLDNAGTIKFASVADAHNFVIGGDSGSKNQLQYGMTGKIKTARIYNQALSAADVQKLSNTARKDIKGEKNVAQVMKTQLVGPADIVTGHTYNLNIHTNQADYGDVDKVEYDVTFDPNKFEYLGATNLRGAAGETTVTKKDNHTLHIVSTAQLSKVDVNQYGETRLAQVQLKAKAVGKQNATTAIAVKNANATMAGQTVSDFKMDTVGQQSITIHAKNINDYNGDGIVGAGDVALAPEARKAEVAKAAEIRPYKHVIVLTTDGGGNPWDPSGMYYTNNNKEVPRWTTSPTLLAKRKNSYAMNLFNKQFAMSTTAQAVQPTISAQNYSSMLHGLAWDQMDAEYQMTNSTAGQKYFADFGKKEAKYPSVFKVLQKNNPTQGLAAFAEWHQIIDGITEPDAAVEKQKSNAWKSFDDVANYIGSDKFNDTSLMYMQSDQMDGQGHGHGWYNDEYWATYSKYDALFKEVMDKLESTGHIHDTLVIANSDHGGSKKGHGADDTKDASNYNTYLALGGETIDAGRRLSGGSNADVSSLILKALQVAQPKSMTGKVFDSSAFLDQTELAKKNRKVESVNLEQDQNKFALKFKDHENRQIRTVDARIDLGGRSIDKISVPAGAKVIRQEVQNGILKLTLSFNKQPGDTMAVVTMKPSKAKAAVAFKIEQAMLGTDKGIEVLPDLKTSTVNKVSDLTDGTDTKPQPSTPAPTTPGNGGAVTTPTKPTSPAKPDEAKPTKPAKKNKLKGKVVYAQKKIGFYKSTKFTKKNRYKFFTAKSQNKWAQFKLVTKTGNRYKVKDINKGSKTYGKTGYITSSSKYITSAEYTKKPIKVKVISTRGLSAYNSKTLKGKHKTYKRGTMLKVKKLVTVKGKTRLQLKNGKYITADKHMIHAYFAHK